VPHAGAAVAFGVTGLVVVLSGKAKRLVLAAPLLRPVGAAGKYVASKYGAIHDDGSNGM